MYLLDSRKDPYGGPFNDQAIRRAVIESLFEKFRFSHVIETGTLFGSSTEIFARKNCEVHGIELDPYFAAYTAKRLQKYPGVQIHLGSSENLLPKITKALPSSATLFIYLDAHFDLRSSAILEELRLIKNLKQKTICLIDDFKIPGDAGFGYDCYKGTDLGLEYVRQELSDTDFYLPAFASDFETGKKRGYCVFTQNIADSSYLDAMPLLRKA